MINESKNIKNESINQITRDNVLALDIAEHCGYYSTHESGTWNFTQRKGKNAIEQHKMFYDTLVEFIQKYNIKLIIAEDVCVSKHFIAARKLSEFRGILYLICAQLGLPEPKFINVSTVKKWATGDGKADKKKMIEYCIKRWNITPVDDNMADATHILKYYVRIYKL